MAEYNSGVSGLPGSEGDGQVPAWYVLSAMGIYPVCPGIAEYWIGSPIFDRVRLHLAGGKEFAIVAKHQSEANKYIQSAALNGRRLGGYVVEHKDVVAGGRLEFEMGPAPVTAH